MQKTNFSNLGFLRVAACSPRVAIADPLANAEQILTVAEELKATEVALPTEKLYVNREDGFIGTGLKRDEFVEECTHLDNIICFCGDGKRPRRTKSN